MNIVIAGEEAGPSSNKLGGIWDVIDAEARILASSTYLERDAKIFVAGPFFKKGDDWGMKERATKLDFEPSDLPLKHPELQYYSRWRPVGDRGINYVLFDTSGYKASGLSDRIKSEAYELFGLDSLTHERADYGREYTHYLELSYAISEFARALSRTDETMLHCHEYSVFYAGARLKRIGTNCRMIATFHATKIGRACGAEVIARIANNDASWCPGVQQGLVELEGLARYFDAATFVGDSTRKEGKLFHGIDGFVVRNGVALDKDTIDWKKKEAYRSKIQEFISARLSQGFGIEVEPKNILPVYTISRMEIENKGYPDLLDALVLYDRVLQNHVRGGEMEEDVRTVCLLITAQTQKKRIPAGFPILLPEDILSGEELRLKKMVEQRGLQVANLGGRRFASVLLYPQWIGKGDGALNMEVDEIAAGCIAGIFPSRYDPFLLTGLEAAKAGTPLIVSRICGFSDAIYEYIKRKGFLGGVEIVDNISLSYLEVIADYSTALYTMTESYLKDKSKYKMMCNEAFHLAREMTWDEPVKNYYDLLRTGEIAKNTVLSQQ